MQEEPIAGPRRHSFLNDLAALLGSQATLISTHSTLAARIRHGDRLRNGGLELEIVQTVARDCQIAVSASAN